MEDQNLAGVLLSKYIWSLLLKFEANPAPGAARTVETVMAKKMWKHGKQGPPSTSEAPAEKKQLEITQ